MRWRVFVFLAAMIVGCGDDPDQDDAAHEVQPCEVDTAKGEISALRKTAGENFHKNGMFFSWNTAPAAECRNNPTVSEGELAGKEMYVTYPTASDPLVTGEGRIAEGKFPVVIFAHANHWACSFFERYTSLHGHWASWGAVVFSVDSTDVNCINSPDNLQRRSDAQRAVLAQARLLNEDPNSMFYQRLDLNKVILAGHSRGVAASFMSAEVELEVKGVIALQGVSLTDFGFSGSSLREYPVLGMTAGEDIDVYYPYSEPIEDRLGGEYTWVNINGGIHSYSAEKMNLVPEDIPLISYDQQQEITKYYTTAFLDHVVGLPASTTSNALRVLSTFESGEMIRDQISALGVDARWKWGESALCIDSFDRSTATTNATGGEVTWEGLEAGELVTYAPDQNPRSGVYSKSHSLRLRAEGGEGWYRTQILGDQPTKNFRLEFRAKGPDEGEIADVHVVFETEDREFKYALADYIGSAELNKRFNQVVIPIDPSSGPIDAIRLEITSGTIFVDDMRFYPQNE